jgi:hypothetical protein
MIDSKEAEILDGIPCKRINIYTVGGHHFISEMKTEASDDDIFNDLLGGTKQCFQILNMCFVRSNVAALVIEDVIRDTQERP